MEILLTSIVLALGFMTLVFFLATSIRDNSIVDIFYGLAFIVVCWGAWLYHGADHWRALLLLVLLTIWGVRLAIHLLLRKKGHGEDFRYRKFREDWGEHVVVKSFFQIFWLQGMVVVAISAPILITIGSPGGGSAVLDWIGAALWLTGFLIESLADLQLLRFISNSANKGRIMRYGIWRFSRHPNYFGEAVLWWGIFLIGLGSPLGIWGIISPVLISFLLLRVSGIPMLEKKWEGNPEYEEYKEKTNAFVPWFPRAG